MATSWSARSPPRAWRRWRGEIEAAVAACSRRSVLVWKNDGGARELEQLPRQLLTPIGRAPEELQVLEHGLSFSAPLAAGAENRLVLRPERAIANSGGD